jgi:hypothetical protein
VIDQHSTRTVEHITTSHRINASESQVIESTDEASSYQNATACTGDGFKMGVLRLWHAIATRPLAIAGEIIRRIGRSHRYNGATPPYAWVLTRFCWTRGAGSIPKNHQKVSACGGFAGGRGTVWTNARGNREPASSLGFMANVFSRFGVTPRK